MVLGVRLLELIGLVAPLVLATAMEASEAPPSEGRSTRLDFVFDDGFFGSPELIFNFRREAVTYSRTGQELAEHLPRYADTRLLASAPIVEKVRITNNPTRLFASGLDHDGITPLLVVYEATAGYLDVFTVAGDDLLLAEMTGVGRVRSFLEGGDRPDLMGGTIPGRAYQPYAGAVCHGLIVLACQVWQTEEKDREWEIGGTALACSQNQGRDWHLLYSEEDYHVGRQRGREWALQNWWPTNTDSTPLEAWFTLTDYEYNPGALGGRTYLFRSTRSAMEEPWEVEPVQIVFEGSEDLLSQHAHTAAVLPFGETGLQVLSAYGDGIDKNRIVRLTRPDREYLQPGWSPADDFHGSHRYENTAGAFSGRGVPSEISFNEHLGLEGNQFVGCAPAPDLKGVLAGSDLRHEHIVRIAPGSEDSTHPITSFVYGAPLANGELSECFMLRSPTPERGGPYVARYSPRTNSATPPDDNAPRFLYSPDGDNWGQAWSYATSNARPALHGPHIYMDSHSNSGGIQRVGEPAWVTGKPLCVGPGGLQKLHARPIAIPSSHARISRLARDANGAVILDGEPLPIQPPTGGPVYHIWSSRYAASDYVGYVLPMSTNTGLGSQLGTDSVAARWWVLGNDPSKTGRLHLELVDHNAPILTTRRAVFESVDRWLPQVAIGEFPVTEDRSLRLRLYDGPNNVPDQQDLLVAFDLLIEGLALPGYPMQAIDQWQGTLPILPDEFAAIQGFNCSSEWTIFLAVEVPDDSWDSTVELPVDLPLFTIWGDEENYVEVFAELATDHVRAEIVRDGETATTLRVGSAYWLRGSSLLIALSDSDDGMGIRAYAAAANKSPMYLYGDNPHGFSASLAVQPTEIRFHSHHDTASDGLAIHVTPLLWWGGEVRTDEGLNGPDMCRELETLGFLWRLALRDTDLNKDGQVDGSDLGILLATFGRLPGDPAFDGRGDINQDGTIDISDLGFLLADFNT
jgi:hypothetical protein